MIVNVIQIGNSKGVRLPKSVLQQCAFDKKVDLEVIDGVVMLKPVKQPREGWNIAFAQKETESYDDVHQVPNTWDEDEWTW